MDPVADVRRERIRHDLVLQLAALLLPLGARYGKLLPLVDIRLEGGEGGDSGEDDAR
jgi:hypothetical protein